MKKKLKPMVAPIVSPIKKRDIQCITMATTKMTENDKANRANEDPVSKYPKPPFPKAPQDVPGTESAMNPQADHGEQSYRGKNRLTGKAAIITGGDSGIGKAVAIAFAREGADVLISYLDDVEDRDAEDTVTYIQEAGRQAIAVKGDISSETHCQKI
ncbi:MAG TPA: SDR family NAD(P)-dependent oxidoreductase, partial [Parapedobacter sp.]|nr:SDR family NAD(P)-dependent oxidoreductase [Parapedobacter sp.]